MKFSKVLYGDYFNLEVEFDEDWKEAWVRLTDADGKFWFIQGEPPKDAQDTIERMIEELRKIRVLMQNWIEEAKREAKE